MELCPAHLINYFLSTLFMYLPTRQPPCLCCDSLIIFFILWKNIEKFVLHSPLSYQEYVRPILHKSNLDVVVITVIVVTTKTKVEKNNKKQIAFNSLFFKIDKSICFPKNSNSRTLDTRWLIGKQQWITSQLTATKYLRCVNPSVNHVKLRILP